MDCLCDNSNYRRKRDEAHYRMLLEMRQLRTTAARLAATPGSFNAAKEEAKKFEEYELALMKCLRGSNFGDAPL